MELKNSCNDIVCVYSLLRLRQTKKPLIQYKKISKLFSSLPSEVSCSLPKRTTPSAAASPSPSPSAAEPRPPQSETYSAIAWLIRPKVYNVSPRGAPLPSSGSSPTSSR